jgi:hypothetical protein
MQSPQEARMKRNSSSDLGERQAEGNLGNERNRGPAGDSSEQSRSGERMRNRSDDPAWRDPIDELDDLEDTGMPSRGSER